MADVRRAFLWASAGRYLVMAVNLAATAILSRLLSPGDYGISVLGGAVLAVAEAIRALGGGTYLIQKTELSTADIRSSFTVSLAVTVVLTAALVFLSGPLTRVFNAPDLGRYLRAAAIGYSTGPFAYTIAALMGRQLVFATLARISVAAALVNAAASLLLAALGLRFMSLAWAGALSALVSLALYLCVWEDRAIFRPRLEGCREVAAFGAYDSAASVLSQIAETLPYIIFARALNAEAVGLCQRAVMLSLFPERVILAGVGAVALPAFSRQRRQGGSLRQDYFRAIELITAALWPALGVLALLADPVVSLCLGRQWHAVVALVQILSVALLFSFPVSLHYPTLVAAGAIRLMPPAVIAQSVVSLGIVFLAAPYGLRTAALSMWAVVPLNALLSLLLVRYVVGFDWIDLARAVHKSAICLALSMIGPVAVMAATGKPDRAGLSLVLAAAGWMAGLWLTGHPLSVELRGVTERLRRKIWGAPS